MICPDLGLLVIKYAGWRAEQLSGACDKYIELVGGAAKKKTTQ